MTVTKAGQRTITQNNPESQIVKLNVTSDL